MNGNTLVFFIVGFVVLGIYKLFELFAKRKERILMIEKLASLAENKEGNESRLKISLPFVANGDTDFGFWPLRISLLLIGIGAGFLLAFFIRFQYPDMSWDLISFANTAGILFFGGIGLLAAYFIEQRKRAQKEEKEKKS